jgi:CRISPR-associated protein Cmr6
MNWTIPLPARTVRLAERNTHPGLLLDKYAASWNERPGNEKFSEKVQRPTVDRVAELSRAVPSGFDYDGLLKRHQQSRPNAATFHATTTGPLTLHVSRASALENAGICLHPIYGFAYLPGSGLKGMAHAYACEVWLASQPSSERESAWKTICAVFGTAPSPWLRDLTQRLQVEIPKEARAGAVVFHDAWPTKWPKLIVDIVNCHHGDYYQPPDERREYPPGDWENPVPVNFLAVPDSVPFEFALAKRRDEVRGDLLELATQWLAGALTHLGAGAKTNAGYGAFQIDSAPPTQPTLIADVQTTWDAVQKSKSRAEFSCTLELVTPAFLAGAKQEAEDCDLRPATLRGALRWWWRTLHVGHVDTATLRRMEAATWGDTNQGGAVRVIVEPVPEAKAVVVEAPFKKPSKTKKGDDKLDFDDLFAKQHDIDIGPPMTTQPLVYLAYGMDELVKEGGKKVRRRRRCIWPGAKWRVRVTARAATFETIDIPAATCLAQARAALSLLAQFGGVGSKARKGFGSVMLTEDAEPRTLNGCCNDAAALRQLCNAASCASPPESDAIDAMLALSQTVAKADCLEVVTPWKNPWFALDQLGAALQSFAQSDASTGHGKHCESKLALGLPRQIHGPLDFKLPHQKSHTPPKQLVGPKGDRHAAPVHFHVGRNADGVLVVRVVAFPAPHLPNFKESQQLLEQLLKHTSGDLHARTAKYKNRGQKWPVAPSGLAGP